MKREGRCEEGVKMGRGGEDGTRVWCQSMNVGIWFYMNIW